MTTFAPPAKLPDVASTALYTERFFCCNAATLRASYERKLRESAGGTTPFIYAFSARAYQFLTASAERFFSSEEISELIQCLRAWGEQKIGSCRVSTPQTRLYINGCSRNLLRDEIDAKWRYSISLTNKGRMTKVGEHRIAFQEAGDDRGGFNVATLVRIPLDFNQLVVHKASSPYGVLVRTTSMDPFDGVVLLEGYLW